MRIRDGEIKDAAAIAALLGELGYPGTEDFAPTRSRASPRIRTRACWSRKPGTAACRASSACISSCSWPCRATSAASRISASARRRAAWAWVASLKRRPRGWRERGCDRIEVHCHERRVDAHRFYYRQGYEESPKYLMKRA